MSFKFGQNKASLRSGSVLIKFAKLEPSVVATHASASSSSSTYFEDGCLWFSIPFISLKPYRATFHIVKPCLDPDAHLIQRHQQLIHVEVTHRYVIELEAMELVHALGPSSWQLFVLDASQKQISNMCPNKVAVKQHSEVDQFWPVERKASASATSIHPGWDMYLEMEEADSISSQASGDDGQADAEHGGHENMVDELEQLVLQEEAADFLRRQEHLRFASAHAGGAEAELQATDTLATEVGHAIESAAPSTHAGHSNATCGGS
eukprot:2198362-Amphidinium_carterae.2